jgi:hypothetical protein
MFSCPPVLLLTFNRPVHLRRVFEVVRQARPSQLFIAADGPRPGNDADEQLCKEARAIVNGVDWPCEVKTLFRTENLGCKYGVSSAITWFFEHVEEGIILEDDCLPHPSFFPYCEQMLTKFRNEQRVAVVCGTSLDIESSNRSRCRFSIYPFVWGWATWRRAWKHYDPHVRLWPEFKETGAFDQWVGNEPSSLFWGRIFDKCYIGDDTTWDYHWVHACWVSGGLSITPPCNLISNIGFGLESTHTRDVDSEFSCRPMSSPLFPVNISSVLQPHSLNDRVLSNRHYSSRPTDTHRKSKIQIAKKAIRQLLRNCGWQRELK